MGKEGEALVACSDRNMGIGVTVWDVDRGEKLLHIQTCAASPHGLLCLRDKFLVASQVNRHGSLSGGAIFIWSLNKPQSPLRSYTMEAIGPVCCTRDGVYLAGGAPSGNAYLWEVAGGRLLKLWSAHQKSLKCMVFSDDGSLLISGSDDGMLCVWSMISLLDVEESGCLPPLLHCSSEHGSSITGLLTMSVSASSSFVSSSLDGTCKVWDLISGRLLTTQVYTLAITSIVLHPAQQLLFCGSIDGSIFVSSLDIGLMEDPFLVTRDQPTVLKGHNGSITALSFSKSGLLSASEDRTICLWDVKSWVILRRLNHQKGAVTNLVVVPQSSLLCAENHRRQRGSNQYHVSLLQKYPEPPDSAKGKVTLLQSLTYLKDDHPSTGVQQTNLLNQQILNSEQDRTPAAMQMKVERSMDDRAWARRMAKHVMEMNKNLQRRLLDLMQLRLSRSDEFNSSAAEKRKKLKVGSAPPKDVQQSQASA